MDKMTLLMVLHSHQPVGNFDHVLAHAVERCYRPVLEILAEYPEFRCGLHFTGPLLNWLETNDPALLELVAGLCARGQAEMLSGGYYEPLLASIPARDALDQLKRQGDYTRARFGQEPTGFWLAERIWEPALPAKLARSGLAYTLVDDTHFYYAGLGPDDMFGYRLTEREGHRLALFPTHKELRYAIPFKEPRETLDFLHRTLERRGPCAATYGDDTEKFGLWPGTYQWVIQKGWLRRFIEAVLAAGDWLATSSPGRYLQDHPPGGRVYPPTASYEEMLTWALPAEASLALERLIKDLEAEGRYESMRRFLRGGLWDNFLVKYPESNLMHKRMLAVSAKVASAGDPVARDHLHQAQCNCAYWHGLFGGLYLGHLRHAVHQHLIAAETLVDRAAWGERGWAECSATDLDADGRDEVIMACPELDLVVHPGYGGSVSCLNHRPSAFNLGNTLTRRREAYHAHLQGQAKDDQPHGQPASIHDQVVFKEDDLADHLVYDWYRRAVFQDHLLRPEVSLADFAAGRYQEWGDLVDQPFGLQAHGAADGAAWCRLARPGRLWAPGGPWPVNLRKRLELRAGGQLTCAYRIDAPQADTPPFVFAVELNLTLLASADPKRRLETLAGEPLSLEEQLDLPAVRGFRLVNDDDGFTATVSIDQPARLWVFGVQTVSASESGLERTYQGSSFTFLLPGPAGGQGRVTITLTVQ